MIRVKSEKTFTNALAVLNKIPEFSGKFTEQYLNERQTPSMMILVAYKENHPVGCKIVYDRFNDGSVYSWLGGVLPEFRKEGVAQLLNDKLEELAKEEGYNSIVFKTRNKFKSMLQFALKNGYNIVGFEKKDAVPEHRIILKKII